MLLSLCVITKNEEKNLPKCLESVKDIVDEMIVIDTGSTDHTVKIAKSYGAKVDYYQWQDNFSDAKNYAFGQAKGDWILTMDADEELCASDKERVLSLLNNPDVDIYLFQTLSYLGNKLGQELASNLNIRLIRNHKGYRYIGAIHEQICNQYDENIDQSKVKIEKIVVYHYGYLRSVEKEKNKSNRNMKILEKVLKNDPNNNFHLYNMGNEYLRIRKFEKALQYYKKAYEKFIPYPAHSPKLLIKMILTLDILNKYDEERKILERGLKYYPKFTDLEYLKACLNHKQKKYVLAIKGFIKCLNMGEAPMDLCNISGVGGYKSYYALGEIYYQLGDDEEAYRFYVEAIQAKPEFYIPLHRIAEILMKKEKDMNIVTKKLEVFFKRPFHAGVYTKLGDLCFGNEKYDVALEYFLKAKEILKEDSRLNYYVGMCCLFLKDYQQAYKYFEKVTQGIHYEQAVYKRILCEILSDNMENAKRLLLSAKKFEDKQIYEVYESFEKLAENKECESISDNEEESKVFTDTIFTLLNMLIKVASPEIFEKSLQLLNLIQNDEVLLRLAKLYYQNGYNHLAYEEFIRSIKIFDKIDQEGLEMMKNILNTSSPFTT
ncbi:tetratricopeptide repeat-containing glycosyltransferase family 2 protein [Crassaminicella profunda]|uniref:tetratricopeptide repeat-containing glycosyltransferase family 2 protein n=1 Tax=Crassaminicella profunda TaxID=1286698 RepID=UPI001CA63FF5|nr:TPR domain-containing glycosyltransferase [Crassaminicella profunda]QZY56326.1 glycosyltransferase [Crassaminicella profunda]